MLNFIQFLSEKEKRGTDLYNPFPLKFNKNKENINTVRFLQKHYSDIEPTLSSYEHQAIHDYKSDSRFINRPLRDSTKFRHGEDDIKNIKHLDKITSHKTPRDLTVYRGFDGHFNIENYKAGDTFKDNGFTGTSLTPKTPVAYTHATHKIIDNDSFPRRVNVIGKIHVPKGTKAYYLDNHYHFNRPASYEKELLIHRGTTFKVTHHTFDNNANMHIVHMTVHKQEDHSND